ncbi:MAG: hypothetical protein M3342_16235 [Bacteroidota bacterium]|nr:hypothetical protein [Bacteroidota bacterium]
MKQIILRSVVVVLSFLFLSFTPNSNFHEGLNAHSSINKKGIEVIEWGERDGKKVISTPLPINTVCR